MSAVAKKNNSRVPYQQILKVSKILVLMKAFMGFLSDLSSLIGLAEMISTILLARECNSS
jgi:hypothetical protein